MSDPALIRDPIIEAAARALREVGMFGREAEGYARTVLAAVTPLIRAQVLEEAAQVAEEHGATEERTVYLTRQKIAAAIRVMKEQP